MTEHECQYDLDELGKLCGKPAHNFIPFQLTVPFVDGHEEDEPQSQLTKFWLCAEHAEEYDGVI